MNFDLGYIKRITDNFSEARKVGSGGYGDVYKGEHYGEDIAVKRLHPLQGLDDLEFHNEFHNLAKIDHPNIIQLIGYCYESQHKYDEDHGKEVFAKTLERVLCFEYMHSGSLQTYIEEQGAQNCRSWFIKTWCFYRNSRIGDSKRNNTVCAKWKGRLEATSSSSSHELDNQRLETCVEIGLRCTEDDPNERPAIKDIVCQLEELEAKSRNKMSLASSEGQSRDFQNKYFPKEENDGPSHKKSEWTTEEAEAAGKEPEAPRKEAAENCFGEVVDNKMLDEVARYTGRPKTQEDRARVAWSLITHDDKKGNASKRVDVLKAMYGNGQSTLCLFYNATGDTLRYVTNHDWYGYIDSRAEYPAEVGNGQWAAFLHVHRQGEPSGSVGAVVYRGKKKDGQFQEYMLAWSTPWGFYYRNKLDEAAIMHIWGLICEDCDMNKAYVETGGGLNYFQRRWDEIYVKLVNSDYSSKTKSGGCEIEAQIDKGDSPKYIATIKLEHGS
ncbi:unnamed protein product [Miscanthus lutarioriparius]|uniref:Protein kinase domain-containing protein n=1 Tax=Miscanthus lutarioriparius TaxID=422564 RepID=A0A811RJ69_9POAL|nr:unnamed protein product [Miscanthus lutarioriparius]